MRQIRLIPGLPGLAAARETAAGEIAGARCPPCKKADFREHCKRPATRKGGASGPARRARPQVLGGAGVRPAMYSPGRSCSRTACAAAARVRGASAAAGGRPAGRPTKGARPAPPPRRGQGAAWPRSRGASPACARRVRHAQRRRGVRHGQEGGAPAARAHGPRRAPVARRQDCRQQEGGRHSAAGAGGRGAGRQDARGRAQGRRRQPE